MATLPDDRVGIARRAQIRRAEHALKESEQITPVGLGARDVHQVQHAVNVSGIQAFGMDEATQRVAQESGAESNRARENRQTSDQW